MEDWFETIIFGLFFIMGMYAVIVITGFFVFDQDWDFLNFYDGRNSHDYYEYGRPK